MNTRSRNKCFWGVKCCRCVGLTTLPPSVSWLYIQRGILNIWEPCRLPPPATGIALLYVDGVCFLWGTNWTVSTATSSQYLAVCVSRLSRQCGILNISQTYRPPWLVTGIALLYGDRLCFLRGTNWTVSTATSSQYLAVNCEPIV
jgi:hypothetical protein